jgi:ADP-ribose pyrophosphatase
VRWQSMHSEVDFRCRIFSVRREHSRQLSTGRAHDFFVIDTPDWVTVVPVTADDDVVMVRQFRHGIGALTLEFPAGLVDPSDASSAVAAARELREETGCSAATFEVLGVVHPNPALQSNRCHIFLARDVLRAGPPQWDHTEEIAIETVPLRDVPRLVAAGAITNALTIVAFHLAAAKEQQR